MDDLLAEFVAECREMLDALAGEIVAWEADPADHGRLDAIFRFFHTVKGNCGFFDFPRLEALSHAAEDVLAEVRAGRRIPDAPLVDAVLAVIDRIGAMAAAIEAGRDFPPFGDEGLIAALAAEADTVSEVVEMPTTAERSFAGPRSIRLPVELLDRIMSGVSDMVLMRNDLARRLQEMGGQTGLESRFNRLSSVLGEVRDAIAKTRMQRIETLFAGFPRLVRDLSAELGKQATIELETGDVELDREMIELIRDPLVHVIRNAIDHGIETPGERRAAGKTEVGLITVSARQTGNEIRIGVIDDGRGVDAARLIEKAIAAGIITADAAGKLSPRERNALMCEPGLSTARAVTAISGRGVGMDVVRANLERMGGSIMIDSTPGAGTRIMLNVPLTLSIVPAITVGVGEQRFAIPRSYVEEIVRGGADEAELAHVGGRLLVTIRDRRVPCIALGEVLGIDGHEAGAARTLVVIRLVGGDQFGIAVDRVIDHEELVVKPVAPALMKTGFYVGTTQLDDGSPILMLDISGVARAAGLIREVERISAAGRDDGVEAEAASLIPALLFVGFDGRRGAVPMSAVERVEAVDAAAIRFDGEASQVVIGDRILPLAGIGDAAVPGGRIELFRLGDGVAELAYAIEAMVDTAMIDRDLASSQGRPCVAGVALVEGEPVDVLDCHALFARYGQAVRAEAPPVCRLPGADRWFQDFLRPLVEAAGYRVINEHDAAEADIAIAAHGHGGPGGLKAGRAIWLRSSPEPTPETAGTIYRYDRDGLVDALRTANAGRGW